MSSVNAEANPKYPALVAGFSCVNKGRFWPGPAGQPIPAVISASDPQPPATSDWLCCRSEVVICAIVTNQPPIIDRDSSSVLNNHLQATKL